jgi:hypothetical protein
MWLLQVGDLLELDGSTWRVKQIDLMYTVLTKVTAACVT